jgi:tRNA (guanine37-N1)-methyltransferase
METSKGIMVSTKDAEIARRVLKEQGVLDQKRAKHRDGVIFPVTHLDIDLKGIPYKVVEEEFEDFKKYDEFEKFLKKITCPLSSYDVIGDIAILEIPSGFENYQSEISEILLKSKGNIKAVFKKQSALEGAERIRKLKWLWGENRTKTVHREHGCQFKLDIAKVFFSPRLSYERQRIKEQVKKGETIVDMFAGVGPYSIEIAKQRDVTVLGYDINETAIEYFKENIRINKVADRVEADLGDCRKLVPKGWADRCIMNLPKNGREFFRTALNILKSDGGIIHYYGISPRENPYEEAKQYILKEAQEIGRRAEIIGKRVVRSYSPSEVHIALDVKV